MSAPTRYEVTARHPDGRTFLVAYTPRLSRPGLLNAMRGCAVAMIAKLPIGAADIVNWATRPRVHAMIGEWTVGFTGRTQLQAKQEGEHPFIKA